MVERPYKCPLCHASFRNESGMMWHVSRRHEAPQALETLGKKYEEKLDGILKEKAAQVQESIGTKRKLDDTTRNLINERLDVAREIKKNIELTLQIRDMDKERFRLVFILVVCNNILLKRFGITLSSLFGEFDNNPQTPIQD